MLHSVSRSNQAPEVHHQAFCHFVALLHLHSKEHENPASRSYSASGAELPEIAWDDVTWRFQFRGAVCWLLKHLVGGNVKPDFEAALAAEQSEPRQFLQTALLQALRARKREV